MKVWVPRNDRSHRLIQEALQGQRINYWMVEQADVDAGSRSQRSICREPRRGRLFLGLVALGGVCKAHPSDGASVFEIIEINLRFLVRWILAGCMDRDQLVTIPLKNADLFLGLDLRYPWVGHQTDGTVEQSGR